MRLRLSDLTPGVTYGLQLRVNNESGQSEWSKTFYIPATSDTYAPLTPAGVAGSVVESSFFLNWNAVTLSSDGSLAYDLAGYEVEVTSSGHGSIGLYKTTAIAFDFSLQENYKLFTAPRANVSMRVRSFDSTGNYSPWSAAANLTNPAPSAVTGLSATAGTDSVHVSWNENTTDSDLIGYDIHLSTTGAAGTYNKIGSGRVTKFVHQSTAYGTDHYYRVYSVDVFGTQSAATQTGPVRPNSSFAVDTTAPGVPTGLAATITTSASIVASANVSWTAVSDPDNDLAEYIIGYRPVGAAGWQYTKVDYTNTSTTIDRLTPYVNYEFRIRSSDWSANVSAWSSTVTTTTASSNTAPAAPTGVSASGGLRTVTVTWTENTENDVANGAGMYEVQIDTVNTFNSGNLKTVKTSATVTSFSNMTASTTYYVRVRAVDSLGLAGSWSSTVSTASGSVVTSVTDGNAPPTPTAPVVTSGIGFLFVTWTEVTNPDPTTYEVHLSTTTGFTPSGATKCFETAATAVTIETLPGSTTPLTYGTTYYVKTIAKDRDGASSASPQGSGTPVRVATGDVGDNAITSVKIVDLAVITAKIADLAVTTAKITDLAVTNAKIGNLAVDTAKIADLAVTNAKIASLSADKITANSTFTNNLTVKSTFTLGDAVTPGVIQSYDYGTSGGTTGFSFSSSGLVIKTGAIEAAALKIQVGNNIMPAMYADFEHLPSSYGTFGSSAATGAVTQAASAFGKQRLEITYTAGSGSWLGMWNSTDADTGRSIPADPTTPIIASAYVWTASGTFAFRLRGTWTTTTGSTSVDSGILTANSTMSRYSAALTPPANATGKCSLAVVSANATAGTIFVDGIQVELKSGSLTTPSVWKPPSSTTIDGGGIRTGVIRSSVDVTVNGVQQPNWSINMAGAAQFGSAFVRGQMIVGATGADVDAGQSYISSGNFNTGLTGWKISSSGSAEFNSGIFRVNLIAGPETDTHAEMKSTGFVTYVKDPISLELYESVVLGRSGSDDFFSIFSSAGDQVASIASDGDAIFTSMGVGGTGPVVTTETDPTSGEVTTIKKGLTIYGKEFLEYLDERTRPVIARGTRITSGTNATTGTELGFLQLDCPTLQGGRLYRASTNHFFVSGGAANDRTRVNMRYTLDGTTPTVSSPNIKTWTRIVHDIAGASGGVSLSGLFGRAEPDQQIDLSLLITYKAETGSGFIYGSGTTPVELVVEDIGPWIDDTGIDVQASSPPPSKKTYVTTWASTASRTWRSDGSIRTDRTEVVHGYDSINGDGRGLWIFPNTITSTLSGATISKIEIYAYATHWYYNSGGTAKVKLHGFTSLPTSLPSMTSAVTSSSWPKPGGRWITLPTSFHAGFLSGTYKGFGMGPAASTDKLYYGRFTGGTGAKIKITYVK